MAFQIYHFILVFDPCANLMCVHTCVMQSVLHDWSDEKVVEIVRNVAAVMRPGDLYVSLESVLQVRCHT